MVSVGLWLLLLIFLLLSPPSNFPSHSAAFLQYFPVKTGINLAGSCSIVLVFPVALGLSSAALTLNTTGLVKCRNWHDSSHRGKVPEAGPENSVPRSLIYGQKDWVRAWTQELQQSFQGDMVALCHLSKLWWGMVPHRICSFPCLQPTCVDYKVT